MSLSTALSIALSGVRTTQDQLSVVSGNIANEKSTNYSRQTSTSSALVSNSTIYGVKADKVTRDINLLVQKQWRSATANSSYADTRLGSLTALDNLWGSPSSSSSLSASYSAFTTALQKLATTPDSSSNQSGVASAAQTLASRLNELSGNVQSLRQEAESNIATAVDRVNTLLQTISGVDKQIVSLNASSSSTASLEDQRDAALDELAQYMDIQVQTQNSGAISVSLTDGTLLYDDTPVTLSFDQQGVVDSSRAYSIDDSQRSLGTVTISNGPGMGADLFKNGSIRSGKIAAYKELRDETLVDAQSQLDAIAATLSRAVGTRAETGTYTTSASEAGYSVDLTSLSEGNTVQVQYSDSSTSPSTQKKITFVATNGAASINNNYTADPDDTVIGIDITDPTTIASQIQSALDTASGGTAFTAAYDTSTNKLTVTADTSSTIKVQSVTGEVSVSGTATGSTALPLFVDSATNQVYTGLSGGVDTITGLAARISVNPKVTTDPSTLVNYSATNTSGDGSRPQGILDALNNRTYYYSSDIGIGSATTPYQGSFGNLLAKVVDTQGAKVEDAQNKSDSQSVITSNLEQRYSDSRAVDLDSELTSLIQLQTAYSANARVLSVAQQMMDTLMQTFQ